MSRRFGGENKLLVRVGGIPVIRRTVRAYVEAGVTPVLIVVGHDTERVVQALADLDVQIVHNPAYRQGQSRALVYGLHALPPTAGAAVIGVGDQPLLRPEIIRGLVARFVQDRVPIVAPRYAGSRGNPVLFERSLFPELLAIEGDQGGRPVIQQHADRVLWLDVDDPHSGLDLDTVQDLEDLRSVVPCPDDDIPRGDGNGRIG
jgi:molybdenum cofactor cytidylyltransferase